MRSKRSRGTTSSSSSTSNNTKGSSSTGPSSKSNGITVPSIRTSVVQYKTRVLTELHKWTAKMEEKQAKATAVVDDQAAAAVSSTATPSTRKSNRRRRREEEPAAVLPVTKVPATISNTILRNTGTIARVKAAPRSYGHVTEHVAVPSTTVPPPVVTVRPPIEGLESCLSHKKSIVKELESVFHKSRHKVLPTLESRKGVCKTHWDFVLEEMKWMANDFYQERLWKKAAANRLALAALQKTFEEEIQNEMAMRSLAQSISFKVATFWRSIERVAARSGQQNSTSSISTSSTALAQSTRSKNRVVNSSSMDVESNDIKLDEKQLKECKKKLDLFLSKVQGVSVTALKKMKQNQGNRSSKNIPSSLYQTEAVAWMESISSAGYNFILNDQFGLAKAQTISCFLSKAKNCDDGRPPVLVIAAGRNVHKWVHFSKSDVVQVYESDLVISAAQRREWDEDKKVESVFVSYENFMRDFEKFRANQWSIIVAEAPPSSSDNNNLMQWECVQRIESTEFKVLVSDNVIPETTQTADDRVSWLKFLMNDMSIMSLEEEDGDKIQKIIECQSLRRMRKDVEGQFYKMEEQATVCTLTSSQVNHYRDALLSSSLTTSLTTGGITAWLKLLLVLRGICNGVEVFSSLDKLEKTDAASMERHSGKLMTVGSILCNNSSSNRFVIYAQMGQMLDALETYVNLLGNKSVRITGSTYEAQEAGLAHFALNQDVRVAIVSTRAASSLCAKAVTLYGASSIIVFDSDWDPVVDSKLRASWQHLAVSTPVSVYRLHCEGTLEASMLRTGSCLTEKLFGELSPRSLLLDEASTSSKCSKSMSIISLEQVPTERPRWWNTIGDVELWKKAQEVCTNVRYSVELADMLFGSLRGGAYEDLDSEEHLLLSNTDELLPIEWYAVSVLQSATDENTKRAGNLISTTSNTSNSNVVVFNDDSELYKALRNETSIEDLFYELNDKTSFCDFSPMYKMHCKGFEIDYDIYTPLKYEDENDLPRDTNVLHHDDLGLQITYQRKPPKHHGKKSSSDKSGIASRKQRVKEKKRKTGGSSNGGGLTAEERALLKRKRRNNFDAFSTDALLGSHGFDDEFVVAGGGDDASSVISDTSVALPKKKKSKRKSSSSSSSSSLAVNEANSVWTEFEDGRLLRLRELYKTNWNIICVLLNHSATSSTACIKRSGRQCSDRYAVLMSSSNLKNAKPQAKARHALVNDVKNNLTEKSTYASMDSGPFIRDLRNIAIASPRVDDNLPSVMDQWRNESLSRSLPVVSEVEKKELVKCFSHVMNVMRGKKPTPSPAGSDSSTSKTTVPAHPSHASSIGISNSENNSDNSISMSPEQVIEKRKSVVKASREITGEELHHRSTGGLVSKHTGTTLYGSTLHQVTMRLNNASTTNSTTNSKSSSLLSVIDTIPSVRTQVQALLQRVDRTEAQKVEAIARILKSTKSSSSPPSSST